MSNREAYNYSRVLAGAICHDTPLDVMDIQGLDLSKVEGADHKLVIGLFKDAYDPRGNQPRYESLTCDAYQEALKTGSSEQDAQKTANNLDRLPDRMRAPTSRQIEKAIAFFNPDAAIQRAKEDKAAIKEDKKEDPTRQEAVDFIRRLVCFADGDKDLTFADLTTGKIYTHNAVMRKCKALGYHNKGNNFVKPCDTAEWYMNLPEQLAGRVCIASDERIVEHDGKRWFNAYTRPAVGLPDMKVATILNEYMDVLAVNYKPEHIKALMTDIAITMIHGYKLRRAWCLYSETKGIGKSVLKQLTQAAIGTTNFNSKVQPAGKWSFTPALIYWFDEKQLTLLDSTKGAWYKEFISEESIAAEVKHGSVISIPLAGFSVFSDNRLPLMPVGDKSRAQTLRAAEVKLNSEQKRACFKVNKLLNEATEEQLASVRHWLKSSFPIEAIFGEDWTEFDLTGRADEHPLSEQIGGNAMTAEDLPEAAALKAILEDMQETGFGYIERVSGCDALSLARVRDFVSLPDRAVAYRDLSTEWLFAQRHDSIKEKRRALELNGFESKLTKSNNKMVYKVKQK